ncbi:GNAT family N-acetyltransferase [Kitasatospora sp. NPDC096147]|uniref:GNAT family N-acetyltransferase n=1 Tax=Kitasatospora sp. NPDC096147 TaxID=3364093 RepID=UPI00381CD6D3
MTLIIRDFHPVDAEAAAHAHSAGRPHVVMSPRALRHLVTAAAPEEHYRLLVGEWEGEVAAIARVGLHAHSSTGGRGFAHLSVAPEARGRGLATALLAEAERHLTAHGATRITAWTADDPASTGFAERHGYHRGRSVHFAHLDLRTLEHPVPPLPEGVELRTAADYADDPRPLFEIDVAGTEDEPGGTDYANLAYEQWLAEEWQAPDLNRELTTVLVADGRTVGFTAVHSTGTRYWSNFTTVAATHRGRGLAGLAKTDSLHRAVAAGLTDAYTGNDATNAPMLAVNDRLGYRRCGTEWLYAKDLPAAGA